MLKYNIPHSNYTNIFIVKFQCNRCSEQLSSSELIFFSDNESESESNFISLSCTKCNKVFNLNIVDKDRVIEIPELDYNSTIKFEEVSDIDNYIDDLLKNSDFIEVFNFEILKLKELNAEKLSQQILNDSLKKLLYAGAVACLEDYLSSTLIKKVLSEEKYLKNFVLGYKGFTTPKFEINKIFEKLDNLNGLVRKELTDIIYHNLPLVKEIYIFTLGIEFPVITEIMEIVGNRHNIIHRNGKDKSGDLVVITSESLELVLSKISNFVIEIDGKIKIKEGTYTFDFSSEIIDYHNIVPKHDEIDDLPF